MLTKGIGMVYTLQSLHSAPQGFSNHADILQMELFAVQTEHLICLEIKTVSVRENN